jgi:hypothetical protein
VDDFKSCSKCRVEAERKSNDRNSPSLAVSLLRVRVFISDEVDSYLDIAQVSWPEPPSKYHDRLAGDGLASGTPTLVEFAAAFYRSIPWRIAGLIQMRKLCISVMEFIFEQAFGRVPHRHR